MSQDVRSAAGGTDWALKFQNAIDAASASATDYSPTQDHGHGPDSSQGIAELTFDNTAAPFQGANRILIDSSIVVKDNVRIVIDSGIELRFTSKTAGDAMFDANAGRSNWSITVGDTSQGSGSYMSWAAGRFVVNLNGDVTGGTNSMKFVEGSGNDRFMLNGYHTVLCRGTKTSQKAAVILYGDGQVNANTSLVWTNVSWENSPGGYGPMQIAAIDGFYAHNFAGSGGTAVRMEQDRGTNPWGIRNGTWSQIYCENGNAVVTFACADGQCRNITVQGVYGYAVKNGVRSNRPNPDFPTDGGISGCTITGGCIFGTTTGAQDQGNTAGANTLTHPSISAVDLAAGMGLKASDCNGIGEAGDFKQSSTPGSTDNTVACNTSIAQTMGEDSGTGSQTITKTGEWHGQGKTVLSASTTVDLDAGSLVLVAVTVRDAVAIFVDSVTDDAGNTYQLAAAGVQGLQNSRIELWYAESVDAATNITVALNTADTFGVGVSQWSGAAASDALDVALGGGSASGDTTTITGEITTADDGELVVAFIGAVNALGPITSVAPAGFTQLTEFTTTGGSDELGVGAYNVVDSGTYSVTFNTTGTQAAGTVIAAFKPAPAAAANDGPPAIALNIADGDAFTAETLDVIATGTDADGISKALVNVDGAANTSMVQDSSDPLVWRQTVTAAGTPGTRVAHSLTVTMTDDHPTPEHASKTITVFIDLPPVDTGDDGGTGSGQGGGDVSTGGGVDHYKLEVAWAASTPANSFRIGISTLAGNAGGFGGLTPLSNEYVGGSAGDVASYDQAATIAEGQLVVVSIALRAGNTNSIASVSDDAGNVYHRAGVGVVGLKNATAELWYTFADNDAATVTVTPTITDTVAAHVGVWDGVDRSAGLVAGSGGAGGDGVSTLIDTPEIALTENALVIGCASYIAAGGDATPSAPANELSDADSTGGSTQHLEVAYIDHIGAGTEQIEWTMPVAKDAGVVIAAFQPLPDVSVEGGSDVFPGSFGASRYDTVPSVVSASWSRGRSGRNEMTQAMEGSVTVSDPGGVYDPNNPDSPLYGIVRPRRLLRISRVQSGTTYPLAYGYTRRISHDPAIGVQETTIEFIDGFELLSTVYPIISNTSPLSAGAGIGLILDACGIIDSSLRRLDSSDTITGLALDGSQSALDAIAEIVSNTLGVFYVSNSGVFTFRDRYSTFEHEPEITLDAVALRPSFELSDVVTKAIVTNGIDAASSDDPTQPDPIFETYEDEQATADFGGVPRTARIDSAYIRSASHAQALAQYLVIQGADPQPPIDGVSITARAGDNARFLSVLSVDVQDVVFVGDMQDVFVVEHLAHEISEAGLIHEATYTVTRRALGIPGGDVGLIVAPFRIGLSTIGSDDLLVL